MISLIIANFKMKSFLLKFIPPRLLLFYHQTLAILAALVYRFPSEGLIVIGVTGTNGKSTTCNLIDRILEEAGFKVGLATTVNFRLAGEEWPNRSKMTMLGRFKLQKLLRRMVKLGCRYAVIETSSQGLAQYRHWGINYDVAVFTNLHSEHIEAHGGFENYKRAKGELFRGLKIRKTKVIDDWVVPKVSVLNLDDPSVDFFSKFPADLKYGYGLEFESRTESAKTKLIKAEKIDLKKEGSSFEINSQKLDLKIPGLFNIYNSLAAVSVGLSQGIDWSIIKTALREFGGVPGRMEKIKINPKQKFDVYIDYAHDPAALEAVYRTVKPQVQGKLIVVLGSAGGGRDKVKRPVLGSLADEFADQVIITNEDPYDEDPSEIINQIKKGVKNKFEGVNLWSIVDRREAIRQALKLAQPGDVILITGKGAEECIMGPKGSRIPWDDRQVAREELTRVLPD